MDQSDSQDFEFDISDLEVEGNGSSAPRDGENVSSDNVVSEATKVEEVADNEVVSDESETITSEAENDDLAGFDLGGLPDASGENSVTIDSNSEGETPVENEVVAEKSAEVVSGEASRIEPESEKIAETSSSMRQLGEDDLGANVFEEIADSSETSSFEDVLDGLMDEVSEFEVGTAVDDANGENADAAENGLPDPFKFDDPDDSVTAQSGVNPQPFVPSEDGPLGESLDVESETVEEVVTEEVEESAIAEPVEVEEESVAEAELKPVEPPVSQPQQPTPSPEPQPVAEQPIREIPSDFEIPADDGALAASEALKAEPPVPLEEKPVVGGGTENVLFDASAEEEPLSESSVVETPPPSATPAEPVAAKKAPPIQSVAEVETAEAKEEAETVEPEAVETETEEVAAIAEPETVSNIEEAEVPEEKIEEPVEEVAIEESPEAEEEEVVPEDTSSDSKENVLFDASEVEEIGDNVDLESIDDQLGETEEPEAVSDIEETEELVEAIATEEAAEIAEEAATESTASDSEETVLFDESNVEEIPDDVDLEAIENQLEADEVAEEATTEPVSKSEETSEESVEAEPTVAVEEEVTAEPVSPDPTAEESLDEESAADEEAEAASLLESVEAIFDEEESVEETIEPLAASGLEILEEEEDEPESEPEPVAPVAEIPGLTEVPEEEEEVAEEIVPGLSEVEEEEEEEVAEAMPSAEDLLMSAASLLNGDSGPAADASSLLDEEEEEEGLAAMPSPADLISEASGADEEEEVAEETVSGLSEVEDDDEEEEFVSMPDPSALMAAADGAAPEGLAILEDDEEEEEELAVLEEIEAPDEDLEKPEFSGNIADNAGGLPPPPPAPIEIIDDDPMEEEVETIPVAAAPEPLKEVAEVIEDGVEIEDPFADDDSLGSLDADLDESVEDLASDSEDGGTPEEDGEKEDGEEDQPAQKKVAEVIEMPKPSLLWRITHSITIAAGLIFIGIGWISFTWKQEIREYMEGRDLDGSGLLTHIRQVGGHALDGFNEDGLYRMQWLDTDIRHVANNEIRLHSLVGAQLRENLYEPVFESVLDEEFGYNEDKFIHAMEFAHENFPEEIESSPFKPWSTLYRLSSPKDEILPLSIVYRVVRENEQSDWELAGIKVRGYKSDLEWATGRPRHDFDEHAQDVDSEEFAHMVSEYKAASAKFVANMDTLKKSLEAEEAMLAMENKQRRERVLMSLSQGAFFSGIAILGEDSDDSKGVTMVVTEVRQDVGLLKGVFQISGGDGVSKHFIGSIDFKKSHNGLDSGMLNLTTIAFEDELDGRELSESTVPFFSPSTITRMRLKTDGFRLEGDTSDIALRMTRHM